MQALLIISLAMAILAVVFALQNNAPIALNFLTRSFQSSLAVVILVAVAAGVLASYLAALPGMIKLKWHLRSARHRVAELENAAARAAVPTRAPEPEQDNDPETMALV